MTKILPWWAAVVLAVGLLGMTFLVGDLVRGARGEDYVDPLAPQHQHGDPGDPEDENGIPNWYDPNCCNKADCKPVLSDALDFVLTPDTRAPGAGTGRMIPGVVSKLDGFVYTYEQIRKSQDSRYHECVRGTPGAYTHFCVYIPWGV